MADTELASIATERTSVTADDWLYLANAAGTTDYKAKIGNMLPGGRVNVLGPATGISADGVTDDATDIGTLLSPGGAFYFPPGDYLIDSRCTVDLNSTTEIEYLDVLCAEGARFIAGPNCNDNMFVIWSNIADFGTRKGHSVKWVGGFYDMSDAPASETMPYRHVGYRDSGDGTKNTNDVFRFASDGLGGALHHITLRDMTMTARAEIAVGNPAYRENAHWMGDSPTDVAGGDTAIFVDGLTGTFNIENIVGIGFRDSVIYINEAPRGGFIRGCMFWWSVAAVQIKRGAAGVHVSDCYAWGCVEGFGIQNIDGSDPGADECSFANCTVVNYERAYQVHESNRVSFSNCKALDGGYLSQAGSALHCDGRVLVSTMTAGQTIGITVGGTDILNGGTTETFDTDIETTVKAVVANINAYTATSGVWAQAAYDNTALVGSPTFTHADDLWTLTSHGLSNGDDVRFSNAGTGPTAEFLVNTIYYVVSSTANTFQLAATPGGAAITASADSAGTWTLYEDDWIIGLNKNNAATGNTIAVTGTVTTATVSQQFAFSFDQPVALDLWGCRYVNVDGLQVIGTDATWSTGRSTELPIAFNVRSMDGTSTSTGSDIQSLDVHITDAFVDDVGTLGGEITETGATNDADRTRWTGLRVGDDMDDHAGITLLGAASYAYYAPLMEQWLSSDVTIPTTSYVNVFDAMALKAGAWYDIYIDCAQNSGDNADDVVVGWTLTGLGTVSGGWSPDGPGTALSSSTGQSQTVWKWQPWTDTSESLGGVTSLDTRFAVRGRISPSTSGTLQFKARKLADTAGDMTVYAMSRLRLRQIG